MLCEFKRSTENVGLKIHPEKTNILSNQCSNKRKEVTISNIKVEVLLVHECAKYLGQKNDISETRNERNQEQNPSSLGVVLQIQIRADVKISP